MKKYTQDELREIFRLHSLWLDGSEEGVRANLRSANLSYADLSYADLRSADLSYANLSYADLRSANLSYADLRSANLRYTNLSYADLRSANLSSADLRSANLRSADLSYADLSSANLSSANLSYADLRSADLRYTNLSYADLSYAKNFEMFYITQISPQKGSFIGFKKSKEGVIIELEVLEKAKRLNSPGYRKCRASAVKILKFHGSRKKELTSMYNYEFKYKLGSIIKVKDFNNNVNDDCGEGIHYFLTKEEAENYNF